MGSEWVSPQRSVYGNRRQTAAYQTTDFRKTIFGWVLFFFYNHVQYVRSAKDLALHETQAIKKLRLVT